MCRECGYRILYKKRTSRSKYKRLRNCTPLKRVQVTGRVSKVQARLTNRHVFVIPQLCNMRQGERLCPTLLKRYPVVLYGFHLCVK